jgi:hypothetical protein
LSNKITLGGEGGWDYLNADDATGMLYVSHGKIVNVVDMKTGQQVATITDVNGVHGIAITRDLYQYNSLIYQKEWEIVK